MDSSTSVLESQLDWITATVHNRDRTHVLAQLANQLARRETDERADVAPFHLLGYVGWRTGRVRYGERENAGLIQLSGDLAEQYAADVLARTDRVSRIDAAVTVKCNAADYRAGQSAYTEATTFYENHPGTARPWRVEDADGGCTTYVGDRASDYFLRVYDKGAEAHTGDDKAAAERYLNCWRYELEVKGGPATVVADQLVHSSQRGSDIRRFVYEYTTRHGINPLYHEQTPLRIKPGFQRRSDYARKMNWLTWKVRPTVDWCRAHGELGDVLAALGLQEPE